MYTTEELNTCINMIVTELAGAMELTMPNLKESMDYAYMHELQWYHVYPMALLKAGNMF